MQKSLTGKKWLTPNTSTSSASTLRLPPWICQLLAGRGLNDDASLSQFLEPSLSQLSDPALMQDLPFAIERIRQAVLQQENIVVYGDYDVDGVCSAAIVVDFLQRIGAHVDYYIPARFSEGYGLNENAVRTIAARATLLITTDCGITAFHEISVAKQLGCDVIVVDHHQVPEQLPEAVANLNPQRQECNYPFKHMCAAGVAFILVTGLRRLLRDSGFFKETVEPDLRELLDLTAIATVADMVPMLGLNRILVKSGLKHLAQTKRLGLQALMQVAGIDVTQLTASDLGFKLGPRINARGRLGHAKEAVELLLTTDIGRAQQLALLLEQANKERQQIEKQTIEEALILVEQQQLNTHAALVVYQEHWHPGVLGLVASRLVERFCKPTFVIGEQGKGSGRSAAGFNLHQGLLSTSDCLKKFGGHHAACGLTILPENIAAFRERLSAAVVEHLGPPPYTPTVRPDIEITTELLTLETVDWLERMGPFGQQNPEPLFVAYGLKVLKHRIVGEKHLKLTLSHNNQTFDAIAFKLGELSNVLPSVVDAVFYLERNTFLGRTSLQLRINDLRATLNVS